MKKEFAAYGKRSTKKFVPSAKYKDLEKQVEKVDAAFIPFAGKWTEQVCRQQWDLLAYKWSLVEKMNKEYDALTT